MSYGTCDACGSEDCEGYEACAIRTLRSEVERLTKERDEQLEDSERIIAALVRERDALKSALRDVAKRQREACARAAQAEATGATKCEGGPEFIAAAVRATPPVTEGGE